MGLKLQQLLNIQNNHKRVILQPIFYSSSKIFSASSFLIPFLITKGAFSTASLAFKMIELKYKAYENYIK